MARIQKKKVFYYKKFYYPITGSKTKDIKFTKKLNHIPELNMVYLRPVEDAEANNYECSYFGSVRKHLLNRNQTTYLIRFDFEYHIQTKFILLRNT